MGCVLSRLIRMFVRCSVGMLSAKVDLELWAAYGLGPMGSPFFCLQKNKENIVGLFGRLYLS